MLPIIHSSLNVFGKVFNTWHDLFVRFPLRYSKKIPRFRQRSKYQQRIEFKRRFRLADFFRIPQYCIHREATDYDQEMVIGFLGFHILQGRFQSLRRHFINSCILP